MSVVVDQNRQAHLISPWSNLFPSWLNILVLMWMCLGMCNASLQSHLCFGLMVGYIAFWCRNMSMRMAFLILVIQPDAHLLLYFLMVIYAAFWKYGIRNLNNIFRVACLSRLHKVIISTRFPNWWKNTWTCSWLQIPGSCHYRLFCCRCDVHTWAMSTHTI